MSSPKAPDYPVLTVSQFTSAIKHCLEKTFPLIWLQGETSNCKPNVSGHLYFSLKDTQAQISAVMFRPDALSLKTPPKDGMQVIVRGEINVFPPSGKYQIVVRELRPVGLGELLLKLEELKIKLHKKGWFRSEHKKPLPKFPKRIGVVTSPTGAAIQDMLNILTRRFSGFHLILNPVKVQGEGAAQEIAKAIEQFNHYDLVDVLIVGRGGGSIEDLWAFNEEIVAEAIFNSRIPIISAVGHETDHCIADYVADVRAPTPSAAAEIVIAEKAHQLHHLLQLQHRIKQTVCHLIRQDRQRLYGLLRHPLLKTPFGALGLWVQQLDTLKHDIDDAIYGRLADFRLLTESKRQQLLSLQPAARLKHSKQQLIALDREMKNSLVRSIQIKKQALKQYANRVTQASLAKLKSKKNIFQAMQKARQLDSLWKNHFALKSERLLYLKDALDSINPKKLLTKGYCILFSEKDHSAITSVHSVEKNQNVQILLSDGDLLATVKDMHFKYGREE